MENEHMDAQHAVINAQKGDCSIINFGSCLIIYDFGLKESFNNIRIRLEHILEPNNYIKNAFLILSHDHDDHKGALLDVINYLRSRPHPPKLFFISPLSRKSALRRYGKMNVIGDRTNFGRKEITIQFSNENIKLQVVYPTHEKLFPKDYNWNSLVTAITVNGQIILLTGDQYFSFIRSAMKVKIPSQTCYVNIK
jgi:beta-lactamase superfamily II metal-dependent hydrolase